MGPEVRKAGARFAVHAGGGPALTLAVVLHFHQPTGTSPSVIEEAFEKVYEPLLDRLEQGSQVRLNLHFAGTILEHALARQPAFLDRLARLWDDERIELLGGAFHDPVLPSIPERDAIGQLTFTANFYKKHFGKLPKGAWLCLRTWDPALIRALVRSGVSYTLLDDAQFVGAGLHPNAIHGHYTTERAGHTMAVFPIDAAIVETISGDDDPRPALRRLAEIERGNHAEVFAGDGHKLIRGGRLGPLMETLESEYHWLKTTMLEHAWANQAAAGRVYLPTSCQPELGEWCRPAAAAQRQRHLMRELAAMGVLEQAQQLAGGVVFDNFLVKYPEVNRLHKRMLRVSQRIDELRGALARHHRAGKNVDKARGCLEKACSALWRSQNHSVYWHGGPMNTGIYDTRLRQGTLRELLLAEKIVDRVLDGKKPEPWQARVADHDADGRDEVLVKTAFFSAVVHPGEGASLSELDLRQAAIALHSSLSPVEEPYHQRFVGNEVALVLEDDAGAMMPALPVEQEVEPVLAGLTLERVARRSFQDLFLGPETTLMSWARRQFRDMGTFASDGWVMMKAVAPGNGEHADCGEVILGRSGVVKEPDKSLLLRMEKRFGFDVGKARLIIDDTLVNRSRDAASVWFGLEWTLGLLGGDPDAVTIKALSSDDKETVAKLSDGPVDLGEATWLEIEDRRAGLAIVVELSRPMDLWWAPVTTIHQGADEFAETVQGSTLLLHAPMQIWGQEEQRLQVRVDFLPVS
ncbi:MAG: DUF1926 domain-containing protein [Proteobacteria bacterium]|nr:DUF1926 domain-containing protein [Pseudomonadota bacterium]